MCFYFVEGQCGDGCLAASIWCRHERRRGDLFVRSWSRVDGLLWEVLFLMRVPQERICL